MVTCRDSKEAKSSWAPRGTLLGQSACSGGGELVSSTHKRVKLGGISGLLLGVRAKSSGCVASSGSNAVGSSGNKALSSGAGVIGSFIATSNMLRFNRSPISSRGQGICRGPVLLCRASLGVFQNEQHTSGEPWPVPPFLHATPLDNLEFPGTPLGEDSLFTPTHPDRAEWTTSHLFPTVQLVPWRWWFASGPAPWLWHCLSTHP